ncbi:MBL fold metallo-hydrolase [Candidatus Saccharibacteria bacterium]|nr:MBL fold metallo-hydrolase [Candidatus Saccharibacteria bacterium]
MKLTKYEHSCVVLEKEGKTLVIDPGGLSGSFVVPDNCVGVVITHEHFDHLDQEKLQTILAAKADVKIYTNKAVVALLSEELKNASVVVSVGDTLRAGDFTLEFVGGVHEEVRPELTRCENTGVIVDGEFYHPGDAHFVPEKPVKWIGIPLNAPWSKVSETNEFVKAVKARNAVPIHDGLLSEAGVPTYENHITAACEMVDTVYHPIKVGETIELT